MDALIVNILDMRNENGEDEVVQDLSVFSSPFSDEIEKFIKKQAMDFAKRKLSITYIVFDAKDGKIVGYFTLAHKALDIDGNNLSNAIKKRLRRYSKFDRETNTYTASAFLLAQFGKNYAVDYGRRIRGKELMEYAMDILSDIQHRIGGGVVYLDAEDRPKLTAFYENEAKYKCFGERFSCSDGSKYLQYMRLL